MKLFTIDTFSCGIYNNKTSNQVFALKEKNMPIYEYYCPRCQKEFEMRLSFSQSGGSQTCPKCHSAAQRQISSFACKTGGNIQAAEKPFRQGASQARETTGAGTLPRVMITPPPSPVELLSPPAKKKSRSPRKKK
jgi:putative FmdB family regulatory protein